MRLQILKVEIAISLCGRNFQVIRNLNLPALSLSRSSLYYILFRKTKQRCFVLFWFLSWNHGRIYHDLQSSWCSFWLYFLQTLYLLKLMYSKKYIYSSSKRDFLWLLDHLVLWPMQKNFLKILCPFLKSVTCLLNFLALHLSRFLNCQ